MRMSPGSLPSSGTCGARVSTSPTATKTRPRIRKARPSPLISASRTGASRREVDAPHLEGLLGLARDRGVAGEQEDLAPPRRVGEQAVHLGAPGVVHAQQRVVEDERQALALLVEVVEEPEAEAQEDLVEGAPADRMPHRQGLRALGAAREEGARLRVVVEAGVAPVGHAAQVLARAA